MYSGSKTFLNLLIIKWQPVRDSNPRGISPSVLETDAVAAEPTGYFYDSDNP